MDRDIIDDDGMVPGDHVDPTSASVGYTGATAEPGTVQNDH